jgi:hypothetical protein
VRSKHVNHVKFSTEQYAEKFISFLHLEIKSVPLYSYYVKYNTLSVFIISVKILNIRLSITSEPLLNEGSAWLYKTAFL